VLTDTGIRKSNSIYSRKCIARKKPEIADNARSFKSKRILAFLINAIINIINVENKKPPEGAC